jgi:hypothetical protein
MAGGRALESRIVSDTVANRSETPLVGASASGLASRVLPDRQTCHRMALSRSVQFVCRRARGSTGCALGRRSGRSSSSSGEAETFSPTRAWQTVTNPSRPRFHGIIGRHTLPGSAICRYSLPHLSLWAPSCSFYRNQTTSVRGSTFSGVSCSSHMGSSIAAVEDVRCNAARAGLHGRPKQLRCGRAVKRLAWR